jgi:crotonobetainyl-CoA:carnitine CoA-transferase CaiB-like acyl-CoA transferase
LKRLRNRPQASSAPLVGVQVLDLSRVLSGPYCSMLLGDAGADVVKIERPGTGDDTRRWGPPFVGDESTYFLTVNRNKRSVAIDLARPEGVALVRRLALASDVVLDNFRPGTMRRWGLDHPTLARDNPRLVSCSITGWGEDGPSSQEAGYDAFVMARTGLMHLSGETGGRPVRPGVAMLDMAAGLAAFGAITTALLGVDRTGVGRRVDVSLLQVQTSMLCNPITNHLMAGLNPDRMGAEHPSLVPYNTYRARDGFVMIGALHDQFWRRLCAALGLDELAHDRRLTTNADRVAARQEVNERIEQRTEAMSVAELCDVLRRHDVPVAPINDIAAAALDPQISALGLLGEVEHPSVGPVPMVAPPVDFGARRGTVRLPPPRLGEHTEAVLRDELGVDQRELEDLRAVGVIA